MFGTTIEITPTIDTVAYSAGDQVGGLQTLNGVNAAGGRSVALRTLTVVDRAKQKAAMTVYFFDESPTVASSNNAAANVSSAEMVDKCLGKVAIASGDYSDLTANSTATVSGLYVLLKPKADGKLFALAVTSGTPTFVAASDLVFKYSFEY